MQLQGGTQAWGTPETPTYPGGIQGYAMANQPQPGLSFNIGLNRLANAAPQPVPYQGGAVTNTVVGPTVNTNQVYEPHVNYTQKIDQRAPAMVPGLPNYHMPDVQALNVPALQMPQQMPQQPPPAAPIAYAQPPATAPLSFDLERAPNNQNIYARGFEQDLDRPRGLPPQPQYDYPDSIPQAQRQTPPQEQQQAPQQQASQQQQQPYTQPYSAGQGQGQQQDGGLEAEMERVWGPNWRQQQQTGNTPAPRPEDYQEDDGTPRPPSYPQVAAKRGFWPALAAAMVGTPGARDLYTKRQAAQAEALKTQFTEGNANYRAELNAQTELAKAGMTAKTAGRLTLEQALKRAEDVGGMPEGPRKVMAIINLQAASQLSGIPVDFSYLATTGQTVEEAARTEDSIGKAVITQVAAYKAKELVAWEIEAGKAQSLKQIKDAGAADITRPWNVSGQIADDRKKIVEAAGAEAKQLDEIQQAHLKTTNDWLASQKGQQDLAAHPMAQAQGLWSQAANYHRIAGQVEPLNQEEAARLRGLAAQYQQMGDQIMASNPQGLPSVMQGYVNTNAPRYPQVPAPPSMMPSVSATSQQQGQVMQQPTQQTMVNPPAVAGVPAPPPGGGLNVPPQPIPMAPQPGAPLQNPNVMMQAVLSARAQLGIPQSVQKLSPEVAKQVGDLATYNLQQAGWTIPTLPPAQQKQLQQQPQGRVNRLAQEGTIIEDARHPRRPHEAPVLQGPAPVYDSSGRVTLPGLEQRMAQNPGQYRPEQHGQFLEPRFERETASHFVKLANGDPKMATFLAQHAGWNTEDLRTGRTTFGVKGNWGRSPSEIERLFEQSKTQPQLRVLPGGAKMANR